MIIYVQFCVWLPYSIKNEPIISKSEQFMKIYTVVLNFHAVTCSININLTLNFSKKKKKHELTMTSKV